MRVHLTTTAQDLGALSAELVRRISGLRVLGVATGSSPAPLWAALAADTGGLTPRAVFALDEYVGLPPGHPAGYRAVVDATVTIPLGLDPARVHVPDGNAPDLELAAAEFETAIGRAGGVDLQVLGIGRNGHIGFNEPGSSVDSRTRVVELADQTRRDNARFFSSVDAVPTLAVTQGIATIMSARRILLIARGESKADAVERLLSGGADPSFPASILHEHDEVTVLLDASAARRTANIAHNIPSRRFAWAGGTEPHPSARS